MSTEVQRTGRPDVIEAWDCPRIPHAEVPDWEVWGGGTPKILAPATPPAVADPTPDPLLMADFEKRLGEATRRSFEAGRLQGAEQGRAVEQTAQGPAQQRLASQVESMLGSFAEERERYLRNVEREVVKLALAVAARILRREAQMDPLLLTGAVRVALGQLAASTSVRLRVPPVELDLWSESIAHLPNMVVKPQVIPGDGMRLGDCMVETELGTVDLGVRAQLSEIERGFFDRATSAVSASEIVTAPEMSLAGAGRQP